MVRCISAKKVVYVLLVVLSMGMLSCEPDNPLRGTTNVFTYIGVDNEGKSLIQFNSDFSDVTDLKSITKDDNQIPKGIYRHLDKYYVQYSNPNSILVYGLDYEPLTEIDLPDGDIANVDFVNSTEALVTYDDKAEITEVDLFFNALGLTHSLPFIPYSSKAVSAETQGNRALLLSDSGRLGYFDVRQNIYVEMYETGVEDGVIIEKTNSPNIFVCGTHVSGETEELLAVEYDIETGTEISRAEAPFYDNEESQIEIGEEKALAGVWGNFSLGYLATNSTVYMLRNIENGKLQLTPSEIDLSQYSASSADASNTRNFRGVNFLLQGDQSYLMSFEERDIFGYSLNYPSRRIVSLVPLD